MDDDRTLGQLLDEYLAAERNNTGIETVYLYRDQNGNPHCVLTLSKSDWDYTDIFSEHRFLVEDIEALRSTKAALRDDIRDLKRDEKSIRSAIEKLVKHGVKK